VRPFSCSIVRRGLQTAVDSPDASGVLFSHGSAFGGHALYLKDRKLKYVYNFVGSKRRTIDSGRLLRS
jgi:hypothetical protein